MSNKDYPVAQKPEIVYFYEDDENLFPFEKVVKVTKQKNVDTYDLRISIKLENDDNLMLEDNRAKAFLTQYKSWVNREIG